MVAGVEGLLFGLLPLRFLDGPVVMRWSRAAWGSLISLGGLGFVTLLLGASADPRSLWPLAVMLGTYLLPALGFWAVLQRGARADETPLVVTSGS